MSVLVLSNPKSGFGRAARGLQEAVRAHWSDRGELQFHVSQSREDSDEQIRKAIDAGVSAVLVSGGDGMINSVGAALLGSDVPLGVLPAGSGNGFARHFGIPLSVDGAAAALAAGTVSDMDVGRVNGTPFFVTCGLGWDAGLVDTYEAQTRRGVLGYVVAGLRTFKRFEVQPFEVDCDEGKSLQIAAPFLFTAANLNQYGGGARIAPQADALDHQLDIVWVERPHALGVCLQSIRLFTGSFDRIGRVQTLQTTGLSIRRSRPGPLQIDGERLPRVADIRIELAKERLNILLP